MEETDELEVFDEDFNEEEEVEYEENEEEYDEIQDEFAVMEAMLAQRTAAGLVEVVSGVVHPVTEVAEAIKEEKVVSKEETRDTRIAEIKELAQLIHPDRWAFDVVTDSYRQKISSGEAKYQLAIHFPEVTISNSRKEQHQIKDLYIIIYFNNEVTNLLGHIYGFRGTLTKEECKAHYAHSHLTSSAGSPEAYSLGRNKFCTGDSNTESSISVYNLKERYNAKSLKQLLLVMYTMADWESLEGTPHMHLSTVSKRAILTTVGVQNTMLREIDGAFKDIYKSVLEALKTKGTTSAIVTKEKRLSKVDLDLTIDYLDELMKDNRILSSINRQYTAFKNSTGKYFNISGGNSDSITHMNNHNNHSTENYIIFNGQRVHSKAINDSDDDNENAYKVLNPSITRQIIEKITKDFTNYLLNK